VSKLVEIEMDN